MELEHGRRLSGGWDEAAWALDEVPRYLRENRGIFLLGEAPEHIAPENFADLTFVMNLTDCLTQRYYDDGVEGCITAKRTGDAVAVSVEGIPLAALELYTPQPVRTVTVNGAAWAVSGGEGHYTAARP